MTAKPPAIFDRDHEWSALAQFAVDDQPGATLGVVSGRRRQGKTFLLQALCQATGGFYFGATEALEAESLRRIGDALTGYLRAPAPLRPADWHEVVDALLAIGRDRPVPVVLDEFPYLARSAPELPSVLQAALAPLREQRRNSRTRLLLCGSAMSFMGRLLAGDAPLRGRAGLELIVRPLDHRLAAEFWGMTDHRLAVRVNAVLGGTPAYRRELARNDTPTGPDDFDDWVLRTVLNPGSPLFLEARYLLAEEADLRDHALYHSVLGAVAEGNHSRGGIANYLNRKASDLTHPLHVLEDVGLLVREADAFRDNRSSYRIAEPLISFYHAVMRPVWDQLEHPGHAGRVWQAAQPRFTAKVLGPRFEQICREWALRHAAEAVFGGLAARVGHGTVADPGRRSNHEVDVAVFGAPADGGSPLLAIGEAKWGEQLDLRHLERLRRIRSLMADQGRHDTSRTRLCCFGGNGFSAPLRQAAAEGEVVLIDLEQLYT